MRIAALLMLFAACAAAPPGTGPQPDCALAYRSLVGAPMAAVTLPDGLSHRIIPPGTAITMDYSADRVNFDLDAGGRITRVWCG